MICRSRAQVVASLLKQDELKPAATSDKAVERRVLQALILLTMTLMTLWIRLPVGDAQVDPMAMLQEVPHVNNQNRLSSKHIS